VRHKVADVDGPVHYVDFGGVGTPLVMVHGLGGAAINWMAVGPELAETRRVIALDLAGFGETPLLNRSATVGANARLVHGFVEKVVGEPVVLIGNSMGGHIAVLEAAAHPEAVRSVVLVDAAIPGPHVRRPPPLMLGAMAALSVPGLAQTILDHRVRTLGAEGLVMQTLALVCADPSRVSPEVVEAHVHLTRERSGLGRQNARAFIQASRSIGLRMASPAFWTRAAAVSAPVLVVHGSLDRLIPVDAARRLVEKRPDWELKVLQGVGHVPMMETPDLFLTTLKSWSGYRIASAAAAS
jgi:pimeloyl-ACP methyl ester carboxylesterase